MAVQTYRVNCRIFETVAVLFRDRADSGRCVGVNQKFWTNSEGEKTPYFGAETPHFR